MKLPGILRLPEYDKANCCEILLCKCFVQVSGAGVWFKCFVQVFGAFARANISINVTNANRERASVTDDCS